MFYNAGWANLKPQESKYTPALAAEAAKLLEAGESLSAVSRSLNISRATIRNWRSLNPTLNASFAVFEANKAKTAAHQQHVRRYKEVAEGIVDAARDGAADPVEAGVKKHTQAEQVKEEAKPMSAEQRQQRKIQEFFDSDWGPLIEEQQAQLEAERDAEERDRRVGFWTG
jgi:hypothetical protein